MSLSMMRWVVAWALVTSWAGAGPRDDCRARRPVFWLHVHNAGGTSIRTHAERNGEVPLEPATHNWNLAFGRDWDCGAKAALLAEQPGASFTFVERPLEPGDLGCPEFAYGVTLRAPLATARSTLVNNRVSAADVARLLEDAERRRLAPRDVALDFVGERYAAHALGYFDNFLVRTLCGGTTFRDAPIGSLNQCPGNPEKTPGGLWRPLSRSNSSRFGSFLDR